MLAASAAWVIGSSELLMWELDVPARITLWEIGKGLLFIAISGFVFYLVYPAPAQPSSAIGNCHYGTRSANVARSKRNWRSLRNSRGLAVWLAELRTTSTTFSRPFFRLRIFCKHAVTDNAARGWVKTIRDAADRGAGLTRQLLSFGQRGQHRAKASRFERRYHRNRRAWSGPC